MTSSLKAYKAPAGRFRVIGYDRFSDEIFDIIDPTQQNGVYDSYLVAQAMADLRQTSEDDLNGQDNDIAATFHVINDTGKLVYSTRQSELH